MAHPALFLDRDGVINKEINYLYKKEDFEFIDGIFALCRHFQDQGYAIFVVTNQSGIARGYYTEEQFADLSAWMVAEFEKNGVHVSKVYHCPHHPDFSGECRCRKPEIGMFLDAQKEFGIDLENSLMVGDHERDIEAAHKALIKQSFFFDEFYKNPPSKASKVVHKLSEIYQ
jgi:D-glycero-D-manno-heptose 1,7-bisphosphate phosphatase